MRNIGRDGRGNFWLALFDRAGLLLVPLASLAIITPFLPVGASTWDLSQYLIPWMKAVLEGGLTSISGEFSNYTPPYIYLMYLTSWLVPAIGIVAAIKIICLPFIAITSAAIYKITVEATGDRKSAMTAACLFWALPTVFANAFGWGQADIIYTCFAVLFVLSAMRGKSALAAVMFGVAVSFKLQAMFVSPLLFYLFLVGRMRIRHLILVPITYAVLMIPAVLAGRPWLDLLMVYAGQARFMQVLSVNAANPWIILQHFVGYKVGTVIGLGVGLISGLAIALSSVRLRPSPQAILLIAAVSAAVMPYVLPKMHERYFFMADVLTFALAFTLTRYWLAALLIQMGSIVAYMFYLAGSNGSAMYALVPMTLGICVLMIALLEAHLEADLPWRDIPVRVWQALFPSRRAEASIVTHLR